MPFVSESIAIALINAVIGEPTDEQINKERKQRERARLQSLGLIPHEMGGIATKGCGKCKGTMYRTEEKSGGKQWVCSNPKCGAVE